MMFHCEGSRRGVPANVGTHTARNLILALRQMPSFAATTRGGSSFQSRGVPAQMVFHEGGDEVVAVVVAGLAAQGERNFSLLAGGLQQLRAQLLFQKRIGI